MGRVPRLPPALWTKTKSPCTDASSRRDTRLVIRGSHACPWNRATRRTTRWNTLTVRGLRVSRLAASNDWTRGEAGGNAIQVPGKFKTVQSRKVNNGRGCKTEQKVHNRLRSATPRLQPWQALHRIVIIQSCLTTASQGADTTMPHLPTVTALRVSHTQFILRCLVITIFSAARIKM
jgi:hypothetical protein